MFIFCVEVSAIQKSIAQEQNHSTTDIYDTAESGKYLNNLNMQMRDLKL